METRILTEVEEMINKVREQQGRAFDMRQLTASCVANVIMNMLFGYRFDHSDEAFQQMIYIVHYALSRWSFILDIFPLLRFLPYFRKLISRLFKMHQTIMHFIDSNIAACIQVCISLLSLLCFVYFAASFCLLVVKVVE